MATLIKDKVILLLKRQPTRSNAEIAKEVGCCARVVWRYRYNLEARGYLIPRSDLGKARAISAFLKHTEETIQSAQEYLHELYTTIPSDPLNALVSPESVLQRDSKHGIMNGLFAMKKTIALLEDKFTGKTRSEAAD